MSKIKSAIVNAADKDFTSFKQNVSAVLTDKLQSVLTRVVDEKQKTLFQKSGE